MRIPPLHTFRRPVTAAAALAQVLIPMLPTVGLGVPIALATARGVHVPEQPIGPAFSIWFPIFMLALVYAAAQYHPASRNLPVFRRLGWWPAGAFGLGALWMLLAQTFGNGWHLVAVIWLFYGVSLAILLRATAVARPGSREATLTLPLFGLLSGWLGLAVWLSTTGVVWFTGAAQGSPTLYALLTLVPAGAGTLLALAASNRSPWLAAAALWGLGGIIINNTVVVPNPGLATVAAGLMLLVTAGARWRR